MSSRETSDDCGPAPRRECSVIVGFGTYDTSRHPRVGIILDGLASRGFDVVEINHPLGFSTADRVRMLAQPWRLPRLIGRMLTRWASLWRDARTLRRRESAIDAVIVGYMGHFDILLARMLFRRERIVLDHLIFAADTAQDRGAAGLRVRFLSLLDRYALRAADVVVVDTPEHLAMLPSTSTGVVVPVGARVEWHEAGRTVRTPKNDALSVIFFGLFTPLQGATVISQALRLSLDRGAKIEATLVGRGQDWESARAALGDDPAVTWVDWVEPDELPARVAAHDVCLGIFGTTDKALRVIPNKAFEGLAAGCAVITSDTPPQRALLADAALLVPAGNPAALADALVALADSPSEVESGRRRARAASESFRATEIVAPLVAALEGGA